jgi:hypothetical protein
MECIYEKQVTMGAQTAKSTAIAQHVKLPIHKTLARFGYQYEPLISRYFVPYFPYKKE